MAKPVKVGRPKMSMAEKVRRSARPHETAGEVVWKLMRYGASLLDSARYLEERGYRTPTGKLNWTPRQAYFEYYKARVAKGKGRPRKKLDDAENRMLAEAETPDQLRRTFAYIAANASLEREGVSRVPTYPLRTKIKTVEDRTRAEWWQATEAARRQGEPGPPEPRFDSRGRPLKGRRFSKIRKPTH